MWRKNRDSKGNLRILQSHSEEFVKPETIELGLLLLSPDRKDLEAVTAEISKKLAADPENFAALARQYSSGPDAENGGNLGLIERRRLRPEFAAGHPPRRKKGRSAARSEPETAFPF